MGRGNVPSKRMALFLFRCPFTNRRVQGWSAEDVSDDGDIYLPVECVACRRVHHVKPTTGKVLGGGDDEDE
jgi:hypothetical protein